MSYKLQLEYRGLVNERETSERDDEIRLMGVGIDKKGNLSIFRRVNLGNDIDTGEGSSVANKIIFETDLSTRDNLDYLMLLFVWEHDAGGQTENWPADNEYKFNTAIEERRRKLVSAQYNEKYIYFQAFAESAPQFFNALNEHASGDEIFQPVFVRFHYYHNSNDIVLKPIESRNTEEEQLEFYHGDAHYRMWTRWIFKSTDPSEPTRSDML
jgi:hypothetical protein